MKVANRHRRTLLQILLQTGVPIAISTWGRHHTRLNCHVPHMCDSSTFAHRKRISRFFFHKIEETDAAVKRTKATIREAQVQTYAEILKSKIGVNALETVAYTDAEKTQILAKADAEKARILAAASVDTAELQALIGAVYTRLQAKTESARLEAEKQVETARAAVKVAGKKAAAEIIKAMVAVQTEAELIRSAATVAAMQIVQKK